MTSELSESEKVLKRACSIIRQYVPKIDENKIKDYFRLSGIRSYFSHESDGWRIDGFKFSAETRFIMFEDHNVSSEGPSIMRVEQNRTGYTAHFREDKSLIEVWEEDYFDCGYNIDELVNETRDGYLGLLDLVEGKYLRVNGHGDTYEFGDPNAPDEPIDWSLWHQS